VGRERCMVDGLKLSIARNLNSIEEKLETVNIQREINTKTKPVLTNVYEEEEDQSQSLNI